MPICVQGPLELLARWTINPLSLLELSFQVRLIWLEEAARATSPEGAAGTVPSVAAHAWLLGAEMFPALSDAETVKQYDVIGESPVAV